MAAPDQNMLFFRDLNEDDIPEIMRLADASFPKSYEQIYFEVAVDDTNKFFMLGCFSGTGFLLGFLMGIYNYATIDLEWRDELLPCEEQDLWDLCDHKIAYVCLIAVDESKKGEGIGTFLMEQFKATLNKFEDPPKAIYLHVLCSNADAIGFYKNINFTIYCFLPKYYDYDDQKHDAYILLRSLSSVDAVTGTLDSLFITQEETAILNEEGPKKKTKRDCCSLWNKLNCQIM